MLSCCQASKTHPSSLALLLITLPQQEKRRYWFNCLGNLIAFMTRKAMGSFGTQVVHSDEWSTVEWDSLELQIKPKRNKTTQGGDPYSIYNSATVTRWICSCSFQIWDNTVDFTGRSKSSQTACFREASVSEQQHLGLPFVFYMYF